MAGVVGPEQAATLAASHAARIHFPFAGRDDLTNRAASLMLCRIPRGAGAFADVSSFSTSQGTVYLVGRLVACGVAT
jgi:hypothetical protein